MVQIGRLLTSMVTPFNAEGEVNYVKAAELARGLVKSGSDGVVVAGTTGEAPTLTREEQTRLFKEVRDAIETRYTVVAGTGSNSTDEAITYTQDAEGAGADAVLLVAPYYNKPAQSGLYSHFKAIAENTSLPCILYNVPSRTSVNLSAQTTIRLSELPNIIGIKESSGNFEQSATIIEEARDGFVVWSGNDADIFPIMCMGGYGAIVVASHLVGRQFKNMMQMLLDGSVTDAAAEHRRLLPIMTGIYDITNPMPIRYLLNHAGFSVGRPRLPLTDPDPENAAKLDQLISKYQIDLKL
jgi:4-hydroxy-tetrahydrodipicolinate synthase